MKSINYYHILWRCFLRAKLAESSREMRPGVYNPGRWSLSTETGHCLGAIWRHNPTSDARSFDHVTSMSTMGDESQDGYLHLVTNKNWLRGVWRHVAVTHRLSRDIDWSYASPVWHPSISKVRQLRSWWQCFVRDIRICLQCLHNEVGKNVKIKIVVAY